MKLTWAGPEPEPASVAVVRALLRDDAEARVVLCSVSSLLAYGWPVDADLILVLCSNEVTTDLLAALESAAVGWARSDASEDEVAALIRGLLGVRGVRRTGLSKADLCIEELRGRVTCHGAELDVTPAELAALTSLVRVERCLGADELQALTGQHIPDLLRRLRGKLRKAGSHAVIVYDDREMGYRLLSR